MNAELKRITDEKLVNYHRLNATVKKGQIFFAGSSLMEMFPIEKFMEELGNPFTIYNRGVGGYKTEDMLKALDICVFELEPKVIFINIGTNDLSDPNISIEQMIENYHLILTKIREKLPSVKLYLMAYYPVNYDAAVEEMKHCLSIRNNQKIEQANQEVKKLAERIDASYIDINNHLKDTQGNLKAEYTIEGMHIKEEGYRAIMPELMKVLKDIILK